MSLFLRSNLQGWSVLAILILLGVLVAMWRTDRRARATLHASLLGHGRAVSHRQRVVLLCAAALCLVMALLGPSWGIHSKKETQVVRDVYLAIDVSRSMKATDVAPNRLTRVRQTVASLMRRFPGYRYSLILFAAQAWLRVPLTWDHNFVNEVLSQTDPENFHPQGTDLKQPLRLVSNLIDREKLQGGTVVLVTDGEHNGPGSPFDVIPDLTSHHVRIIAVGVGNPEGAPVPMPNGGYAHDTSGNIVFSRPNFSTLDKLAMATGGVALKLNSSTLDWDPIGSALERVETRKKKQTESLQRIDRTPAVVFVSLLLMLAALIPWPRRRHISSMVILLLLLLGNSGCANREGFSAYHNKQYKQAAKWFAAQAGKNGNPAALNNLGASLNQLKNYPVAVSAFLLAATRSTEPEARADSLYNAGNSLFQAGDLERAIGAYKASLKIREDEDTRVNLEVAKRLLKKRQQKARQPKKTKLAKKHRQEQKKKNQKNKQGKKGQKKKKGMQAQPNKKQNAKVKKKKKSGQKSSVLLRQRMKNLKEAQPRPPGGAGGDSATPW